MSDTSAACPDHLCDGCGACRRGRCCKRDLPNYRLPETGTWDGPVWGDLGVLLDDGERVQCHICGEWFMALHVHVIRKHNVWAQEYKAYFGLNRRRGLTASETRARFSQNAVERQVDGKLWRGPGDSRPTPEQMQEVIHRPRRLQTLLEGQWTHGEPPSFLGHTHSPEARAKMSAAIRRTRPLKTHCVNGHEFTPENTVNWGPRLNRECRACRRARAKARQGAA